MSSSGKDIGAAVKLVSSIRPKLQVAQASFGVEGVAVLREGFESAAVEVHLGAAAGTPDSFIITAKAQQRTGTAAWVDVGDSIVLTAINTSGKVSIRQGLLTAAELRVVATAAFTGGSTPSVGLYAGIALGGPRVEPVA